MGRGLVSDGAVARSETQAGVMWRAREGIAESLSRRGGCEGYSLVRSVPTTTGWF